MKPIRVPVRAALALAAAAVLVPALWAGFTNPSVPPFRGQPDTEFSGWESFTDPNAPGKNLPDDPGTTSDDASLVQLLPGAVLTGGGNIYQPAGAARYELSDSVPGDLQELHFQTSTDGAELAYDDVRLEYVDGSGATVRRVFDSRTELARFVTTGPHVETLFVWDLSQVAATISAYKITFEAATAHLSLDAPLLDTRTDSNPPVTFCTAKSGLACGTPAIASFGTPSATAPNGFVVNAAPARTCKSGILLYNVSQVAGLPFEGGTLCVDPMGLRRAGSTNSGGTPGGANCDGSFAIDLNAFARGAWVVPACDGTPSGLPPNNPAGFLGNAGTTVFTQWWGRDSVATGSFVSDALAFTIGT